MLKSIFPFTSPRRGSIMMTTVILLIIGSFSAVALLNYTISMGHLSEKRTDSVKAFYIAESGVNRVYHYFNHPEDYPPDVAANTAEENRMFYFETDLADPDYGTFPNLEEYLEDHGELVIIDPATTSDYLTYNGLDATFQGQVKSLSILPPDQLGTPPVSSMGIIRSVGETRESKAGKQEKTILLYFTPGAPPLSSPAAIISKQATGFNGNVEPHWGEVWSKHNVDLKNGFSKQDIENFLGGAITDKGDPWTAARTEGQFMTSQGTPTAYLDGRYHNNTTTLPNNPDYRRFTEIPAGDTPYYEQPFTGVTFGNGANAVDMGERFFQHQSLDFPQFDYDVWKTLAQQRGEYYSTELVNGQTKIYRNGIETAGNEVTNIMTEFFANAPYSSFRMIFIDTLDGNPPAANGSNIGSIQINGGTNPHLRGVFYANANLGITGLGNPPTLRDYVERPDGVIENLRKVWVDGIIYTSGGVGNDQPSGGNFQIYGSLIAEKDILANGGPDVYYNHRLKDGDYFPVGSRVSVAYFKVE